MDHRLRSHAPGEAGDTIDEEEAERLLRSDLQEVERGTQRLVEVPLNANEFSALVSLAYNIGLANFSKSTVLKRLNAGNRFGAADAFGLWIKARVAGRSVILPGLRRRRAAERALFLKPVAPESAEHLESSTRLRPDRERFAGPWSALVAGLRPRPAQNR